MEVIKASELNDYMVENQISTTGICVFFIYPDDVYQCETNLDINGKFKANNKNFNIAEMNLEENYYKKDDNDVIVVVCHLTDKENVQNCLSVEYEINFIW